MKCVNIGQRVLSIHPNNYEWKSTISISYRKVSAVYKALKDEKNAKKFMLKAMEVMPNKNAQIFTLLADEYMRLKNFDKAREYYLKSFELDINSSGFLNFYELELITNEDMNESIENNYIENFKDKKEKFIEYEMLKIIKNITENKKVDLKAWQSKYRGVELYWGFSELEGWVKTLKDEALKQKINEALEVFKGHS